MKKVAKKVAGEKREEEQERVPGWTGVPAKRGREEEKRRGITRRARKTGG